ncbi:MAG: DUF438 domain-containing protein [Lachnobacterium sp.]|nr:DUF438 domain-containing protein [Lachnobacterium sp.]
MEHNTRVEQIKTYLERLSAGEELEKVRADFIKEFEAVDPAEIMQAEQKLLQGGTPLAMVQKLCDVHAALFRGNTSEEKIASAEKAVAASVKEKKLAATAALIGIAGHPLQTFTLENEVLENVIRECRKEVEKTEMISQELFGKLREVAIHYAKKGDLLYPHLKVKYGISGPSDVMWTTDDEIRDELADLAKRWPFAKKNVGLHSEKLTDKETKWMECFIAALQRVEDMIYKEANIFFPNCALNFTEEEWFGIYRDSKDYPVCFGVENATWEAAETYLKEKSAGNVSGNVMKNRTEEVIMAGGHLTLAQLTAMLNTIPMEITFVDADNINRFFNEGPKDFKRPGMAIDREVFSCHPPKVEQQVRRIIGEFRNGTLDKVPIWMEKNGKTMLVTYMAVRDAQGTYLGTMELVQDMGFAKEHFLSDVKAKEAAIRAGQEN